jgi:hypothetical protein
MSVLFEGVVFFLIPPVKIAGGRELESEEGELDEHEHALWFLESSDPDMLSFYSFKILLSLEIVEFLVLYLIIYAFLLFPFLSDFSGDDESS